MLFMEYTAQGEEGGCSQGRGSGEKEGGRALEPGLTGSFEKGDNFFPIVIFLKEGEGGEGGEGSTILLYAMYHSLFPAARDRLSDLTSKDGDWFLDELCTMSGNVSQMICLLEMCLTSMGHEIQIGTVLYSTIAAVSTVHTVYSSMQVSQCLWS